MTIFFISTICLAKARDKGEKIILYTPKLIAPEKTEKMY